MSALLYLAAVVAGLVQGAIGLRYYTPPPKDGHVPVPVLEAVLFTVVFALLFSGYAYLLGAIRDLHPPATEWLLLVISAIGAILVYWVWTDRFEAEYGVVERWLAVVTMAVVAVFPLLALVV